MDPTRFNVAALTTLNGLAQAAFDTAINAYVQNPIIPFTHDRLCAICKLLTLSPADIALFPNIPALITAYQVAPANRFIVRNALLIWRGHILTPATIPAHITLQPADWDYYLYGRRCHHCCSTNWM